MLLGWTVVTTKYDWATWDVGQERNVRQVAIDGILGRVHASERQIDSRAAAYHDRRPCLRYQVPGLRAVGHVGEGGPVAVRILKPLGAPL